MACSRILSVALRFSLLDTNILTGHIQWCASILRRCMSLVHSPELQLDIFVTNVQPSPKVALSTPNHFSYPPTSRRDTVLNPPLARFAEDDRFRPESPDISEDEAYGGLVDLSYYTGDGDNQPDEEDRWGEGGDHELDLTNFDGDDDTQLPGEAQLSYQFKKEGIMRRAKSRRVQNLHQLSRSSRPTSPESDYDDHRTSTYSKRASANSTARLITNKGGWESPTRAARPSLEVDIASLGSAIPWVSSPLSPTKLPTTLPKRHSRLAPHTLDEVPLRAPPSPFGSRSDVESIYSQMPHTGVGAYGEEVKIEFDEQEIHDVSAVAEHARPGRPKLDRLLTEEVENARGSILVACKSNQPFSSIPLIHLSVRLWPNFVECCSTKVRCCPDRSCEDSQR